MADTPQSRPQNANSSSTTTTPRPLQMGAKGAYIVRLLMVGDSACGKTSLVLRFDQNVFSTKFVTTIGVDYRDKMIKVGLKNEGDENIYRCTVFAAQGLITVSDTVLFIFLRVSLIHIYLCRLKVHQ